METKTLHLYEKGNVIKFADPQKLFRFALGKTPRQEKPDATISVWAHSKAEAINKTMGWLHSVNKENLGREEALTMLEGQ